jgi:Ca-activated chloride channel family protein
MIDKSDSASHPLASRPRPAPVLTALAVLSLSALFAGCEGSKNGGDRKMYARAKDGPVAPHAMHAKEDMAGNTESYARIVENSFQRAADQPLSTFSIDVDTASYSNVRRYLLQQHQMPPADAVRIEELVNYFPYAYQPPKGDHPVGFNVELGECPWNSRHSLARIGLAARHIAPDKMPPRNLVFLIDTSGSMGPPNRLPLLQSSLKLLVEQLTARDRVAIVAYAGSAGLVLPSTAGNEKATIERAIDNLHAGGSTNGGEGITLAYRVAEENLLKGGVNRVILGTDGDFNVGITNRDDLVRLIEEKRRTGVFLTILGFGMGNLKDATLEMLAHHGNGHYAYIDNEREARKVFVEQGGALVVVAKDVKLQVAFNPKRVGAYRLIGYENRLLRTRDFNDDKKDAGDMGAGHTVTALYEIVPAGLPLPAAGVDPAKWEKTTGPSAVKEDDEWLTVNLRYKDPDAEKSQLLSHVLGGAVHKQTETSPDFRFAAAVGSFGMLLRDSPYKGEATWAGTRTLARGALGWDPGGHRASFIEMIDTAQRLAAGNK